MRFLIIFLFFFATTQTFSQKRDYKKYDKAIKLFQKKDLNKVFLGHDFRLFDFFQYQD